MKASWNWLTDYVPVKAPVAEVARRLTMAGLIVEDITETPDDFLLEVEITSNRPDWLSHLGIAREIAALYDLTVKSPAVSLPAGSPAVESLASLEVLDADLCPLYTARVITGVKVAPSPAWLREKIEAVGLRPVNNIVDVTNYVMYECGQPLHAFDLALLSGAKVVVRRAKNGERITLIDGSKHTLSTENLVIADTGKPIAVAGVMGGVDSEIADTTTDIFLESALFDQYSIRMTAKGLGLSSDAAYRFERGVDLENVDAASRRSAALILDVAGGTLAEGALIVGATSLPHRVVTLRMSRVKRILGLDVPIDRARSILASLGFIIRGGSPAETQVEVPSFRGDVLEEIDLIEEVGRIYGYDKVPVATTITIAAGDPTARRRVTSAVESVLTGSGFYGAVTYSLSTDPLFAKFDFWSADSIYLENRSGHDNTFMRTSLLPSLLLARKTNEDQTACAPDLYEIAHVYLPSVEEVPDQPLVAAGVSGRSFEDTKGIVNRALHDLSPETPVWKPADVAFLAPGRAALIELSGNVVGFMGTLSPDITASIGLEHNVHVFEINVSLLEDAPEKEVAFTALHRFPGVERDLAVIVDESVTWADVVSCIESAGVETLDSVEFESLYRGAPIPDARKSVALHVVFRSPERTLTGQEADSAQAALLDALAKNLSAVLR